MNLADIKLGSDRIRSSLAANFGTTEVEEVHTPEFANDYDIMNKIFSREDVSRIETWRPRQKVLGSITYERKNWNTSVGFNYYGPVTYKHPSNIKDDATFESKTTFDWSLSYKLKSNINFEIGVLNLFNIYPDTFLEAYQGESPEDRSIDFVGRFNYPWRTIHIGIDGSRGFTKLKMRF